MSDDSAAKTLLLPDGRQLGYAEFGDPRGRPVLYFHGFPGSRLEARLADAAARRQGVRLLAIDRPGYGLSDPLPKRSLLDWPRDVRLFADTLGLAQFGVLGVSGGGPFALACAAVLTDRIRGFALACSLGPLADVACRPCQPGMVRAMIRFGHRFPGTIRWLGRQLARQVARRPDVILQLLLLTAPAVDRELLKQADVRDTMIASGRQAFARGHSGVASDLEIYGAGWGFNPAAIALPVILWQGRADRTVRPAMAEYLSACLPACQLRLIDGEGHFSLPIKYMDEILSEIG
jgi:pimeloyl-ACP methyl ester carboxylesterase